MSIENEIQALTVAVRELTSALSAVYPSTGETPASAPQALAKKSASRKTKADRSRDQAPVKVADAPKAEQAEEPAPFEEKMTVDHAESKLTGVPTTPADQSSAKAEQAEAPLMDKGHFMAAMTDYFRSLPSAERKTAMARVLTPLAVASFNDIPESKFAEALQLARGE